MKSNNLLNSFKYALEGILSAFKNERNLKIHTCIALIVVIAGLIFKLSISEWLSCILVIALVIGGELINTAIEKVVDLASPDINPLAKQAKDIAAGAVLFFAIVSVVIGIIIFLPKIINLF